jgi:paraquat-inducible protein B
MSKPANTVAIGAFVSGALLIFFGLAFYLGGGALRGDSQYFMMVFDGSVKGLKVGAPVAFKGVQIGEITEIDLVIDTDSYNVIMPVTARIVEDRIKKIGSNQEGEPLDHLLAKGMRAQLQTQSLLTGLLYIQLDFYPDSKLNYFTYDSDLEQIPTIPTDLERIARNLQEIDFKKLIDGVENSIAGIDKIVNNPGLQQLPDNLNTTLASIASLSARLTSEIETLSPGISSLVTNADTTMQELSKELPELSTEARASLQQLRATLEKAQAAMDSVDYILSDDSAVLFDIRAAAKELGAAGRSLQSLAETLETQPESILKGKSPLGN